MGYNGKAFLAYQESLLEPGTRLVKGSRRNRETSMAARNKYFEQLTDADRDKIRQEYEQEQLKLKYRS